MSGLFGGTAAQSGQVEVYTGIQVSTSLYGACIPLVYGRQRVPFNLMWYGNFTATPNKNSSGGKGGGGSQVSSYTYNTAFAAGIAIGPIVGINQIWHDKAVETLVTENLTLFLGASAQPVWSFLTTYAPPGVNFTGYIVGNQLTVTQLNTVGSLFEQQVISGSGVVAGTTIIDLGGTGGGIGSGYTVSVAHNVGSAGSPVAMSASVGVAGSQAVPYDHIAYVATSSYSLGQSASMPNLTYEIDALLGYNIAVGMYDADPAHIIPDYLTDPNHGAGFTGTISNLLGFTDTYQAYCMSMGINLSPLEDTQREASVFIQEILQATNSDAVLSVGTLKIIPYADTAVSNTTPDGQSWSYTPDLTPEFIFTDADFCPAQGDPPIKMTRIATADTYNVVPIEYCDRGNQYNYEIVQASDLYDITKTQARVMTTVTLHEITTAAVARVVAQLILNTSLYERNTYVFRVRADYSLLEPMDYVAINDTALGLVNQVVRITKVQDDANNFLTITAMEVPGTVRNTPVYNWSSAAGFSANYATAPGSVTPPYIFQMPAIPASLGEGITLGIAVGGPSDSNYWKGCNIFMSTDGGSNYFYVGQTTSGSKYGTLLSPLAAPSAEPDTTHTLAVALTNTSYQLSTAVTDADANSEQTLILIGTRATSTWSFDSTMGPTFDTNTSPAVDTFDEQGLAVPEVLAYGACALAAAGEYNLTYLQRGLYGTSAAAHTLPQNWVRLDGNLYQIGIDPGYGGQTVYFKFTSFNTYGQGQEDIADVVAYPYTIPVGPVAGTVVFTPVGACTVYNEHVYKATTAAFAWDSGAVSTNPYSSLYVEAQYSSAGMFAAAGLVSVATNLNPTVNMDFCIYADGTSSTLIMQKGVTILTMAPPALGDIYLIKYDGFTVYYYVNGVEVWNTPAQGLMLFAAIAEYSPGAVFANVESASNTTSTPTQWRVTGNATANDTHLMKEGGVALYDSNAYSLIGYPTCHVAFKVNALSNNRVVGGFSQSPSAELSTPNIDYAWTFNGLGEWQVTEGGAGRIAAIAGAATDLAYITYDGTNLTYYLNTVVQWTTAAPGLTLYGNFAFDDPGAGVNSVNFGPTANLTVQDTGQLGENAATTTYLFSISTPANLIGLQVNTSVYGSSFINPPNYACTAIVTLMGFDGYTSIGTPATISLSYIDSSGSPIQYGTAVTLPTTPPPPYTSLQWQFVHAASTATGSIAIALSQAAGSTETIFSEVVMQVEFIKR